MTVLTSSIIVFGATIVEAIGLTALRAKQTYSIPIASLFYALGVVPLLSIALKYEGIGIVNFFWNVLSTITMFLVGIYFFKEKLHSLQVIGVVLSLFGIFLILMAPDGK
jgi:multidrug transporter EmrE-like cation transporter